VKPLFIIFIILVILTPILDNQSWFKGAPFFFKSANPITIISDNKISASDPEMITFIAGGDVMLGRSVNTRSRKNKDFSWAFRNISQEFYSADISFINLESPLTPDCNPTDAGMIFCAPFENVDGLKTAGIDIANLANNHIGNYGKAGKESTISILRQNNITPVGFEAVVKEIKGVKFGFLGYNALEDLDESKLASDIATLKKQVDVLIATFHWGAEYQAVSNPSQKKLGHLAIDSGADIVIGHHPHWVQEKEIYFGKPIYYSLGNLIFDQAWSGKTQEGLVVKFIFSGKNFLTSHDLRTKIYDYGQPRFVNPLTLK